MRSEELPVKPVLVRELIGESLREERVSQGKTLREVSRNARVSLGYLSEVERGQKEASSELLAAICAALDLPLSVVLNVVSEKMASYERVTALAYGRWHRLPPDARRWAEDAAPEVSSGTLQPAGFTHRNRAEDMRAVGSLHGQLPSSPCCTDLASAAAAGAAGSDPR